MNPATSAYIDPNTLTTAQGTNLQGAPELTVKPTSSSTSGYSSSAAAGGTSSSTSHSGSSATPTATGVRQRVNKAGAQLDAATDHPAVKNAKGVVGNQIQQLRELLGRSVLVRNIEARTKVDRVILAGGALFAYILFIPLNLLHLALPMTTLLAFLPPVYLAVDTLDRPNSTVEEDSTKALLSYFVVLGFIQFIESLAAGFLARRIPQYYTLKLILLAYLAHPQTQGALKVHQSVFRPLLAQARRPTQTSTTTPPTSRPAASTKPGPAASTTGPAVVLPSGGGTGAGLAVPAEPVVSTNIGVTKLDGTGQAL